jgi:hypothetical protein
MISLHKAIRCPNKAKPKRPDANNEACVNATWEVEQETSMFDNWEEHVINNAVVTLYKATLTEVLLDNPAGINVLHQ